MQPAPFSVDSLVPMVHVHDVEASLAFYAFLGFSCDHRLTNKSGRTLWASTQSGGARMMFTQADPDPDPAAQAVIFYLYSPNVAALRAHLLASGLHDGGAYCGQAGPNGGRCVVFEVVPRDYMPCGELRVADPDGYCILVGQLG